MGERTYYDVLELNSTATLDEIKASYRRLVKAWHPDLHKEANKAEASEKTREINQAYDVLSSKRSRQDYDKSLGLTDTIASRRVHNLVVSLIRHNRERKAIELMQRYDRDITFEEASQRIRVIKSLIKR